MSFKVNDIVKAINNTYSITNNDYTLIAVNNTFTATLPTAVNNLGKVFILKNVGTGVMTVATTSSQTIDGSSANIVLNQYDGLAVESDGSNWIKLQQYSLASKQTYVAKTANYTITNTDSTVDCTANTFTITLPTAVGITGQVFNIKNSGSGVITINTTSSQTIDGQASGTLTLNQYDNLSVQSNGSNWIIL